MLMEEQTLMLGPNWLMTIFMMIKFLPHDPDSDCQLNYVIVIGDGMFTGGSGVLGQRGEAANRIARLRTDLGVKSLMVAYGDGIYSQGMGIF